MRSTAQTKHRALHSPHYKALAARRQADIVTARTLCGVLRKRSALKGCRVCHRLGQHHPAQERANSKKTLDLAIVATSINAP